MYRFAIILIIIFLLDFYVFRTFQHQFINLSHPTRNYIYIVYWLIPFIIIISVVYLIASNEPGRFRPDKLIFFVAGCIVLFYIPKLFIMPFQVIEDFSKLLAWIIKKISLSNTGLYHGADRISKSFIISRIGLIVAIIPFLSIIYGMVYGRYNFDVKHINLTFNNLPPAFDGIKIVQFSDFHVGSLAGKQDKYKKAIDLIDQQHADILVFTGDIVNTNAHELDGWIDLLSSLKAKEGKFSILGNHDYGDYFNWKTEADKIANLELLKKYHEQMGFKLLLNQAVKIERDSQTIAILGVENWGEKPFPQYGKLNLALEASKGIAFKILLSHDPTHWEHEVRGKTDIALTLSGHTHGMQLAITADGFSWSPVCFKYPRWRGLYKENDQYLYVNIGLGYIGFPGRVGTNPEITVFELHSKK
jgi:uncharacterized protein